ncbi:co-chaperone YbbN [Bacillus sp. E214]|uniref:thioredoxin family protein n=1 Tax=Bacillus sp. E214 TaxID=2587156 RepID=UPI0011DF2D4D|nr:thioredoxin family protein [Bacillus sp. E214]
MKKVIIFVAAVVLIFAAIAYLSNKQQTEKTSSDNPYGKENLSPATVDQLDDPLYQNIITPDELDEKLEKEEAMTVYYFSPECPHCVKTTPILMPVAEEMDEHIYQYNVLEFEQGWDEIEGSGTPTLIHYKNGKETSRISGEHSAEEFKQWFDNL